MSMDDAAQKQHPLHLPEVLFQVALYLDAKDVLACSLVSRTSHSAFEPYVWRNLHIGVHPSQHTTLRHQDPFARFISIKTQVSNNQGQSQLSEGSQPSEDDLLQVLHRASPWIRSLSIHKHYSTYQLNFNGRCTMLESLSIEGPPLDDQFDTAYWDNCKTLVRKNSANLRSLTMMSWGRSYRGRKLPKWSPLSECVQHKNLRSLRIQGGSFRDKQWASYWKIFEDLESLTLEFIHLPPPPSIANEFPRLRTLVLHQLRTEPLRQLDWIIRLCPMLQTLEWTLEPTTHFPVEFTHYFVGLTWPELGSISIKGHRDYMSHEDYISILKATQRPFRVLDLKIQSQPQDLFDMLRQSHFKTLTKVDLFSAVAIPQCVQEVLESCPLLEHITAKVITAQDITNGRPWVCIGLKEFKVMINMGFGRMKLDRGAKRPKFTESEQGLCHAVFEQLGRLEQLHVLDLRRHYWFTDMRAYFPLPLELRLGLGQLSRLEDIEVIGFHGSQDLRMTDVEWMLQTWRYLTAVYGDQLSSKRSGTFENEYVRNHKLASVLNSRGVRFQKHEDDTKTRGLVGSWARLLYDTESESEGEVEE
ncbi:MAG: hypothetical protein J3Q66DRAFT_331952 [Benniella sp.]|nr:MAG: hypothetical protein J3Q66DRAFT_331952 [Benniella sp.]